MKNFKTLCIATIVLLCINESLAQCSAPPDQAWNWVGPSVISNTNRLFGTRNIAYDEFHNIYTVANLEGGSVTIGGFTVSAHYGFDNILIKQDQNGNVLWAKSFGSTQNDDGVGKIACDQNGSIYIAFTCSNLHINGVFEPTINIGAIHIIQFGYNGNFVADIYPAGGSGGIGALEFYNGDLYFSDGNTIKKRDALGVITTVVTLNNTSTIRIWNIKHAPNGDWIINGYFTSPLSYDGVTLNEYYTSPTAISAEFIFRLNSSNNVVYGLRMDGLADFYSGSLGITFDNQSNLLFGGIPQGPLGNGQWRFQNTTMTLDYPTNSAIVIKIDAASGSMLWNRQFRSQGSYTGNMLFLLSNPNNETLVVGSYTNGGVLPYAVCLPDYQNFILKLNANGEKVYFQNFGLGGGSFQSVMALTTWDYCKYFITGKAGDLHTVNNPNYNCLTFPYTGMYFTASFNDYSFEIDGNGIDDDCDGQIDENNPNYQRWFQDVDGDGFGNTINSTIACSRPAGYADNSNDCDDNNPQVGYTHWYADADGDGYGDAIDPGIASCTPIAGKVSITGDCNDDNPAIYPNATEVCNNWDDDCDGLIDEALPGGVKLYLPFSGNANDVSGNSQNGTIINTATLTSDHTGNANTAYQFNGSNRIEVPDHPDLRPQSLTLSCWVYYTYVPSTIQSIIGKGYCSGWSDSYTFWFENGQLHAGLGYASFGLARYDFTPPPANQWHHLVLTFDNAADQAKVYINNVLAGTFSATFNLLYENSAFMVGADWDQCINNWYYNGKVDEVMIFDHALTSSEIAVIYQNKGNFLPIEVCNGVDDDCDGEVDEGFIKNTYYADADVDGYGNPAGVLITCEAIPPSGYVTNNRDCDDNNASIHPGTTEVCNGIDDDCDGLIDEASPSGLVLYMPFNGNTNDVSGNNHNGTVYNATLTSDRFGVANSSYHFNGTNARIEIPDHADFHLKNFTIAAWVNATASPQSIISKSFGTGFFNSYTMGYDNNSLASALSDGNISPVYYSGVLMPEGWFHYALTFDDQNNILKFYVNGLEVGSATTSLSINYDNSVLTIGGEYQFGALAYLTSGKIDEVMIYNHALTAQEIESITSTFILPIMQPTWYADADGDGYGDLSVTIQSCTTPSGYVSNSTDCDDGNPAIQPDATEVCNGVDDNCDGAIDESAQADEIPVITVSGSLIFCDGASVTLTSSAANGYLWSTGAITQSITVSESGTYTVTVTNVFGCSAKSTPVSTTTTPLPVAFNLTSTGGQCNSTSPLSIGLSGSQLGVNYQLTINGNTNVGSIVAGTGFAISFGNQTTAGTYAVVAKNSSNCSASMNGNLIVSSGSVLPALSATCSNNNPILYFGFTLDQKATIIVKPTGGAAPYKVSFTMNRPINCNLVNSSGDEIWTPGANTVSSNYITCPASGSSLNNPVSTSTNSITSINGYQVSVTLMQDAIITATITDANGCTYTCTSNIHAEDVRCFAGNSNNVKVTVCHKTGSIKNPCVKICVDQAAVQEHMGHGDFLGNCTPTCLPPNIVARPSSLEKLSGDLQVSVTPNPTSTFFIVTVKGRDAGLATIRVLDIYGRIIHLNQKFETSSTIRIGDKWPGGTYFIEVFQGGERKFFKVIKAK